jgi:hypothetical protein
VPHNYTILSAYYDGTSGDPNPLLTLQFTVDSFKTSCGSCIQLNAILQANYVAGVDGVRDVLQAIMLGRYLFAQSGPQTNYPRPSGTYYTDAANLPPLPPPNPSLIQVVCQEAINAGTWSSLAPNQAASNGFCINAWGLLRAARAARLLLARKACEDFHHINDACKTESVDFSSSGGEEMNSRFNHVYTCDFSEGEIAMTLQVGFVAQDGFIIASDRKATRGGKLGDGKATYITTDARCKILATGGNQLVCAFSGNDAAKVFASELKMRSAELSEHTEAGLTRLCEDVFENRADATQDALQNAAAVIVGSTKVNKLWQVSFPCGAVLVNTVDRSVAEGDRSNAAIYWAERYKLEAEWSFEQLELLAAHLILDGGYLNPSGIGGLDVFVSKTDSEPRFLRDVELQSLCSRSTEISRKVIELFANL